MENNEIPSKEQITLDSLLPKAEQPPKPKPTSPERKKRKDRDYDELFLNKGTPDEIHMFGRFYTPQSGVIVRSAVPERRDSIVLGQLEEGNRVFVVKDSDSEDPDPKGWVRVIISQGERDEVGNEKVRRFSDGIKENTLCYMQWSSIQKKKSR